MTKEEKREYYKKWYEANKEKHSEYMKEYRKTNREKRLEQMKAYYLANREKYLEYQREYNKANREKRLKYHKEWYQENREECLKHQKEYSNTPIGRASYLLNAYNRNDKKYNRGRGDLTSKWIVENIFTKPCAHCGKTDWHELGCNRLDNSKPHSKDNVEPCCEECNKKLPRKKGDN
jgi:hypothetical protein